METFGTTALRSLVVRPITASERERFDATLEVSHWLGAGLVGEVMRYVAEQDGEWSALLDRSYACRATDHRHRPGSSRRLSVSLVAT